MSQAATARSPQATQPNEAGLRELGIYELPDRREFVVSGVYPQGCCLYTLSAWKNFGVAEYWVDTEGRLISKGLPTQWGVEDLKDTGRSV